MTTSTEIKKALVKKLKSEFHWPCYEFGVVEGMKLPCFFTRITTNSNIQAKNIYLQKYEVEITIMYGKGKKALEAKVMEDVEKIKTLFLTHLDTGKRKLPVSNFEMELVGERGNIPQITFDLEFFDSIYIEERADVMEYVEVKEELHNGDA